MQAIGIHNEKWNILLENAVDRIAWKQILAHNTSYCEEVKIGDVIPQPKQFKYSPMTVDNKAEDDCGFCMITLIPTASKDRSLSPPMMIFRGTIFKIEPILDDLVHTIGSRAFTKHKETINQTLVKLFNKYGKVVVMGHSLGGAIAQLTTLYFAQYILTCRIYNSPGIQYSIGTDEFKFMLNRLLIDSDQPKVVHIRHINDLVPFFGGKHLPAYKMYVMGEDNFGFDIYAHSELSLNKQKVIKEIYKDKPQIESPLQYYLERARRLASFIPSIYDLFNIQEMAQETAKTIETSETI